MVPCHGTWWLFKEKHFGDWALSWTSWFFQGTWFWIERTGKEWLKDKIMVICTWVFGRYIFLSEWNEPITSKKQLAVLVGRDKVQALMRNLEFWKICINYNFHRFLTLKGLCGN